MKVLTKEQKQKYLESGGAKCPHCDSTDIDGGSMQTDSNIAWQNISCNDCEEVWTDIYTLTEIS